MEIAKTITGYQKNVEIIEFCKKELFEYSGAYEDGREIISKCFASFMRPRQHNEFVLKFISACDKPIKKRVSVMTGNREFMYWQTDKAWYRINLEKDCYELTDKASERARKSFEMWQSMQKDTSVCI